MRIEEKVDRSHVQLTNPDKLTPPHVLRKFCRINPLRTAVITCGSLLVAFVCPDASAVGGNVEVCVPVDFDWASHASLDLPANLIFEDSGYFSGDLTQTDKSYIDRLNRTGKKDDDGKPLEGAFVLTEAIHLTKASPCGVSHARMLLMIPFLSPFATAANHHIWLGWRVLGLSGWHDDFGKPGGLPLQLWQALDEFHVRAILLSDLADPVSIAPEEQSRLLNADGSQ